MELATIATTGINEEIFTKLCEYMPCEIVEIIMWKFGGFKCSEIVIHEIAIGIRSLRYFADAHENEVKRIAIESYWEGESIYEGLDWIVKRDNADAELVSEIIASCEEDAETADDFANNFWSKGWKASLEENEECICDCGDCEENDCKSMDKMYALDSYADIGVGGHLEWGFWDWTNRCVMCSRELPEADEDMVCELGGTRHLDCANLNFTKVAIKRAKNCIIAH